MLNEKMDGLYNQQRLHTAVCSNTPRFNRVLETILPSLEQNLALHMELRELMMKYVISRVPRGEQGVGFYSRYFWYRKRKAGETHFGCLFQRIHHVKTFYMMTIKRVLECVQHNNWIVSIDLKDAYFQILINHKQEIPCTTACHLHTRLPPHIFQMRRNGSAAFTHSRGDNSFLSG